MFVKYYTGFICLLLLLSTAAKAQTNLPQLQTQPAAAVADPKPIGYSAGMPVNYIRTWQPLKPYTSEADLISTSREVAEVNRTTQYVDGLGRPLQTVAWRSSPGGKDLVAPVVFDEFGRQKYQYLPYEALKEGETTNGLFKIDPFVDQFLFYQTKYNAVDQQPAFKGENVFYSQTNFEASPLNRIAKTLAPGNSWAGSDRGVERQYLVNKGANGDAVRIWNIALSNEPVSLNIYPFNTEGAVYAAGELYKNVKINEAQNKIIEYVDKSGNLILKKVQIGSDPSEAHDGWLCTYYVYDDLNQLRVVIPPKAVEALALKNWNFSAATGVLDGLCFRYEFDKRGRMIAKKLPGTEWVYMVYDSRDRLAFVQDGNMRMESRNWWLMSVYDNLNRPVQSAMLTRYTGLQKDLVQYLEQVSYAGSTISNTGTYSGPRAGDIYVDTWQSGINYTAANSVIIQAGFESGSNAEFTAEIVPGTGGSFTSVQQVNGFGNPGGTLIPLRYTYYDDYSWAPGKQYDVSNNYKLGIGGNTYGDPLPTVKSNFTNGFITGSRVRVIEDANDLAKGGWLETVSFYDDKGREIQTINDIYNGGADTRTSRYSFTDKIISSYQTQQKSGTEISNTRVYTEIDYDHADRPVEIRKTLNDDVLTKRVVVHNEYDALGVLHRKQLGKRGSNDYLETQDYTYNIRGWLKGINWQGYGQGTKTEAKEKRWFAMDLSYDWGFAGKQYNGNIAGVRWVSGGDQQERGYGFGYDASNRLLFADFYQYENDWLKNPVVDFSMKMGDGLTPSKAYDANGNIQKMSHKGMKGLGNSVWIDEMKYTYPDNSNQLLNVADRFNDVNTKLGDFYTSSNHSGLEEKSHYITNEEVDLKHVTDFVYDYNGNVVKDFNKEIGTSGKDGIEYNFLNLPYKITISKANATKGTITFIYDAAGNKLEKRVEESPAAGNGNTGRNKVTSYANGFVYENQLLQMVSQEEGRTRPLRDPATQNITGYAFDYFLRDHLGNVRTVISDDAGVEKRYIATIEDAARKTENDLFERIQETETAKPDGFETLQSTDVNNKKVARLTGTSLEDKRSGPGIVLKVMRGDKFSAAVKTWYLPGTAHGADPGLVNGIVSSLASAFAGGVPAGGAHGVSGQLLADNVSGSFGSFLNTYNTEVNGTDKPKAYLNWILLDEQQLKMVNDASNSGAAMVPRIESEGFRVLQANSGEDIEISKNGYLYVYVSNESKGAVYFDDLVVEHTPGPLLEESHYYPFGLQMAGISSKATGKLPNKFRFNSGSELQNGEFTDGSGLELYDAVFRTYDPQIGRFMQEDPLSDLAPIHSTYAFVSNNPLSFSDPLGLKDSTAVAGFPNSTTGANILKEVTVTSTSKKSTEGGLPSLPGARLATGLIKRALTPAIPLTPPALAPSSASGLPVQKDDEGSKLAQVAPYALTLAAADGPLPIGDIVAGAVITAAIALDQTQRTYITYTLTNPAIPNSIYVGRASGMGDPASVLKRRYATHHMRILGFTNPQLDESAQGIGGYPATRGREQQLYDFYKARGMILGNAIRPVSRYNVNAPAYHLASDLRFGNIAPYTGWTLGSLK